MLDAKSLWCAAALLFSTLLPGTAVRADASDLRLHDSFDGPNFAPDGGLYYKKNEEQSAGTITFQSPDAGPDRKVLELSVQAKCLADNRGCSERAEVWERPEVLARYHETLWYGLSMMLGKPVPTERHRYVMAQWKREIVPGAEGDYSPFLAVRLLEGRLLMTVDTDTARFAPIGTPERPKDCKPGEARASEPDQFNQIRVLVAVGTLDSDPPVRGFGGCTADLNVTLRDGTLPAADSGWVDFVIMVKPGPSGDGHIEIAANGKWIATVKGRIGHEGPGLGDHQYFKFGPYRASSPDPWRIFYDDFKRGPRCADVASPDLCEAIRQ